MNRSGNRNDPKAACTASRRRGTGWSGVAAIVLAFAILHLWLGFTTDKLGYFIGGTCLLVIAGILLSAPRAGA